VRCGKSAWRSGLRGHERSRIAEPEVEAAWRAEFERNGATQLRDALNSGDGFTDELKSPPFMEKNTIFSMALDVFRSHPTRLPMTLSV
jgi:hypothetical protein